MPDSNPYSPPSTSSEPPPKNPAVGFLRVLLWLAPAPTFLLIGILSSSIFPAPILLIPLAIICPAIIGYIDALLSRKIPKRDGFPIAKPAIRHVIIFTLLQIILAPCIIFAMIFGFCAYAGAF